MVDALQLNEFLASSFVNITRMKLVCHILEVYLVSQVNDGGEPGVTSCAYKEMKSNLKLLF